MAEVNLVLLAFVVLADYSLTYCSFDTATTFQDCFSNVILGITRWICAKLKSKIYF
jgi:hypothetical protein